MTLARATDGRRVLRFASGLQIRLSNLAAGGFLIALALLLSVAALSIGATRTGFADLFASLFVGALEQDQTFALLAVRLPRIVIGFIAGWLVAMAGAMLQSLARNPLADPGLFGLSQGSMVVIMLLLVFMPDAPAGLIPFAALAGGLGVAAALIWLAGGARSGGLAILLMGIAVDTVLSSVTSILILYTPPETSYSLSDWLAGSLFQASPAAILAIAPWFVLSLVVVLFAGRALKSYDLGDQMAQALGEPVPWSRPLILFAAVLLSSAAVTAVGPLIFLGVMAPHLAGFLSRATGRARLLLSGLAGGVLVVGADCLTRGFAGDIALPIGLSLTILGVPLFIITLRLRALRVR